MLLDCSQQLTFVDPQAAICWSANLQPQIKSSFKMGQPSEGQPVVASS